MNQPLLQHFDLLATAPGGVARLRELIQEGLDSGEPTPLTDDEIAAIRRRIRAR